MHFVPIKPDMTARLATVSQKMLSAAIGSGGQQSPVFQAVSHHLSAPGLRCRSQIALHAADCLGVDAPSALAMATCCELLHTASLIHDDLQDRDYLRRGKQAVWSLFGDDVALCAGGETSGAHCPAPDGRFLLPRGHPAALTFPARTPRLLTTKARWTR